jgi:NAD(P)-dependent dehydrogenase (short-subunit alcohol dehydrogenase family)
MNDSLAGRVYAVTGASRGFGLAIAQALVAAGARVGITGRDAGSIAAAAASLGSGVALGILADAGDADAIAHALAGIKTHFGRLDGVINNAGLARPGATEHLREDEVRAQVTTNFLGTVFCCQAAIPLLRGGDNPRIVNISSASAEHHDEMSHLSIYAATKAAVERFSRDLRRELQADGIGVTILRPGNAPTAFAAEWHRERFEAALEAWYQQGAHMDVGMDTAHVAAAVVWCLASPPGVSPDLLELRPYFRIPKPDIATLLGDG